MARHAVLGLMLVVLAAIAMAETGRSHPPAILNQAAEKAIAEEIAAFRAALAKAIGKKDARALGRMYAAGFVHTDEAGKVHGKDARIKAALAGDPLIETAPVTDLVIRVPGGWTGIATGIGPVRSHADGKTYALRWTAVYVRIDQDFQLAASQATRLNEIKSEEKK